MNSTIQIPATSTTPLVVAQASTPTYPTIQLELALDRLREKRVLAKMQAAAKSLEYRGCKTIDHIARHSQKEATRLLEEIRYHATDLSYELDDPMRMADKYYNTKSHRLYRVG